MSYSDFKRSFPTTPDSEVRKIYDRAMQISADYRKQGQTLSPGLEAAVDEWSRQNGKPRLDKPTKTRPIIPKYQQARLVVPTTMAKQLLAKSSLQTLVNITNASPGLVETLGGNFWAQIYQQRFGRVQYQPKTAQGWYKLLLRKYNSQ